MNEVADDAMWWRDGGQKHFKDCHVRLFRLSRSQAPISKDFCGSIQMTVYNESAVNILVLMQGRAAQHSGNLLLIGLSVKSVELVLNFTLSSVSTVI